MFIWNIRGSQKIVLTEYSSTYITKNRIETKLKHCNEFLLF